MPDGAELLGDVRGTLARLEITVSLASDAIVWADGIGRLVWCNGAFERLSGRQRIEMVGKPIAPLLALEHQGRPVPGADHPVLLALRGEPAVGQYTIAHDDGATVLDVFASSAILPSDQRTVICVLRDVTEQVEAATESRRLNVQLEAANRELEAFSYSVSHDLRAPLRSIDGFSHALLEEYAGVLDARGIHYLDRVRAAASLMARLIDDLLALSRVTRSEMRHEPVDLSSIAEDVLGDLRQAEPDRRVDVSVEPDMIVPGDPSLLRVVLVNLLGNAWKFTSKRGDPRIDVTCERSDGDLVVHVRDNGVGFDPVYHDKLFAPFQRLHTKEQFPGSGIGLATVQRIVRRHGGRAFADGRPGEGATFSFTVPASSEGAIEDAAQ
jgi:PAS domain S-box-containing protein